ncbi:MAG: Uracil phosphoribosyltransferase, partial [uncultured Acetobacteraceae bacterium]
GDHREPAPAPDRHPPPAGAAQAHAAPSAGNLHWRVPPPRARDQLAHGLRGHARPAAGVPAHRNAAGADGLAHPLRQEALLRLDPAGGRRHPGGDAGSRALRPRRPRRPLPRSRDAGAGRVLPEAPRGRPQPAGRGGGPDARHRPLRRRRRGPRQAGRSRADQLRLPPRRAGGRFRHGGGAPRRARFHLRRGPLPRRPRLYPPRIGRRGGPAVRHEV